MTTEPTLFEAADQCPTCLRPFEKVANAKLLARSGGARETEAARAVSAHLSRACARVLEELRRKRNYDCPHAVDHPDAFDNKLRGWVSRDELSYILGGGDGARRARQLLDFGYRVERQFVPRLQAGNRSTNVAQWAGQPK